MKAMRIIDVSKHWGHIQRISRLALIKNRLEELRAHLEGNEKALGILGELKALCFGKKI